MRGSAVAAGSTWLRMWQERIAGTPFSGDLALAQCRSDNDTDDNQIDASPGLAMGRKRRTGTK